MKILILGANGSLAAVATQQFLDTSDAELTLFVRNPSRLRHPASERIRIVKGDVLDGKALEIAMQGQDVVYANLAGDMEAMAQVIVRSMKNLGMRRLLFVSSMGIYDEVPGQRYSSVLDSYRKSAAVVESSGLDYTVIRPAWFTNENEVRYEITQKGESFRGSEVSRLSVADFIVRLAGNPTLYVRDSVGINRP